MSFEIKNGVLKKYIAERHEALVTIPDDITAIGKSAFARRRNLTGIIIPDGVTIIGKEAFSYCSGLTIIMIPDSVTSIEEGAFHDCSSLTSIIIPSSVTSIGDSAFDACTHLSNINVAEGNSAYLSEKGVLFNIDRTGIIRYPKGKSGASFTIPNGVVSIEVSAFCDCNRLTSITIPDGVRSIGDSAFSGCYGLTSLTIPDSVTSIGDSAFSDCHNLKNIIIPNGVTSIGRSSFKGCSDLTSITIPDSVTSIGDSAFTDCSSLTSLVAKPDMLSDNEIKNTTVFTFLRNPDLFSPNQAESCKSYLFSRKKRMLPEILRNDLVYAMQLFADAKKITKRSVRADFLDPAIEAKATACTAFLMDWENKNVSLEDRETLIEKELGGDLLNKPNKKKSVNKDPFNAADMKKLWSYKVLEKGSVCLTNYRGTETTVVIPERIAKNSVIALGDNVFSTEKINRPPANKEAINKLLSVTLPDTITSIGNGAFYWCKNIRFVNIPSSVSSIGEQAFYYCRHITSIIIPNGVTCIRGSTFEGCIRLTDVTIPDSVTEIGKNAFNGCTRLLDLHIPDSVKKISKNAFNYCEKLTIHASEKSFAAKYAKKNNIPFEAE